MNVRGTVLRDDANARSAGYTSAASGAPSPPGHPHDNASGDGSSGSTVDHVAGQLDCAEAVFAPGDRVDALLGGNSWTACTVVKHNAKQGDYELRCDGKPDNPRVADDAAHVRPATAAVNASTAAEVAAVAALRKPPPDINANLRTVTLARGGQPLSGLYLQLKPMMGNAALGRMSYDYFYFWPDGRLCEMLPPTGTDPADFDAMKAAKPRLCGRYVFTPGKLTIDVPDSPRAWDYAVSRFDGSDFVMDAYPTVRVKGYGSGTVLAGKYMGTWLFPNSIDVALTLLRDGSFDLVETPRASARGVAPQHRQGRYRLLGNTLDLGGERHTVYALDAAKPGRIVIDGRDFDPVVK